MKDVECLCGRKDPNNGCNCEICGVFFCGACKAEHLVVDPEINDELVDITVCLECNDPEAIIEHLEFEEVARQQRQADLPDLPDLPDEQPFEDQCDDELAQIEAEQANEQWYEDRGYDVYDPHQE